MKIIGQVFDFYMRLQKINVSVFMLIRNQIFNI